MKADFTPWGGYSAYFSKHEGRVNHFYRDTKGRVTIGVGILVPLTFEPAEYGTWFYVKNARVALPGDVQLDYSAVGRINPALPAAVYGQVCHTRLTEESIDRLLLDRVQTAENQAEAAFPNYAEAPNTAKAALVDMVFNMGIGVLLAPAEHGGFPKLCSAFRRHSFDVCAQECERETGVKAFEERNAWTKKQFEAAAEEWNRHVQGVT